MANFSLRKSSPTEKKRLVLAVSALIFVALCYALFGNSDQVAGHRSEEATNSSEPQKIASVPPQDPTSTETAQSPDKNEFTDHDSNHEWLVTSERKLEDVDRKLPPGELRKLLSDMIADEHRLEAMNERGYSAVSSADRKGYPDWAVKESQFGNITAERFGAVYISDVYDLLTQDNSLFQADDAKNLAIRASANSELINESERILDRAGGHPDEMAACPEQTADLELILQRAKGLLPNAIVRAQESPIKGFVLLNHSEMLANEVNARVTCFRGWENGKQ